MVGPEFCCPLVCVGGDPVTAGWRAWPLMPLLLFVGILAPGACARAGEHPDAGLKYAEQHAADICIYLDNDDSFDGIDRLGHALVAEGLDEFDAGAAIGESVTYVCPHHKPLVRAYVDTGLEGAV